MTRKLILFICATVSSALVVTGCTTPVSYLEHFSDDETTPLSQRERHYGRSRDTAWQDRLRTLTEPDPGSNPLRSIREDDEVASPPAAIVESAVANSNNQTPEAAPPTSSSPSVIEDSNAAVAPTEPPKFQPQPAPPVHPEATNPEATNPAVANPAVATVPNDATNSETHLVQAAAVQQDGRAEPDSAGALPSDDKSVGKEKPPKDWQGLVREAIVLLKQDLHQVKPDPKKFKELDESERMERAKRETLLRLLYLIANDREDAVRPIKQLGEAEQEFWNELLYGLMVYFNDNEMPRDEQRKTLALQNLRRANEFLATVSNLEVRNAVFCTGVDSYGRYTEVAKNEFRAGQEVLLYVEVDNFSAEQLKNGHYETALVGSYEIRDVARQKVDEYEFVVEKDVSRNRRRDFFIPYRVYIPNLKPGPYTLRLTVQDNKTKRSGQSAPISFTIRS